MWVGGLLRNENTPTDLAAVSRAFRAASLHPPQALARHRMLEGHFPMLVGCAEWRERFEATFEANTRAYQIFALVDLTL